MKLIGAITSPYVRKVRAVMIEKKIEYKFELEDVWSPNTSIQKLNPLGKVPVLIMEDGGAVFDSRVIVEYLDNLTPVHKLIPATGRARAEVRTWEALADGLVDAAILARLESTQRSEGERSSQWVARQMSKIEAALEAMSAGLADRDWCANSPTKFSLADVAVGCALGYLDFRFQHLDWRSPYPNLKTLYAKLLTRESFSSTTPS
jgi:glutathione S-transferase